MNYQNKSVQVSLNIAGQHNVSNALAAASMALVLGCDLPCVSRGLAGLNEVAGRVNSCFVTDQLLLIDDTIMLTLLH